MIASLLLLSCAENVADEPYDPDVPLVPAGDPLGTDASPVDTSAADPYVVVPLTDLPVVLSSTEPIQEIELLGDLDGDGHADALVTVPGISTVVRGPLSEPHVLPGDGWFDFAAWEIVTGDATGDGYVDLLWWTESGWRLVEGPLDAPPEPGDGIDVAPGTVYVDIDRDDVLDVVRVDDAAAVWWGPADLTAAPDLSTPLCTNYDGAPVSAPGDLDGDGRFELTVWTPYDEYGWDWSGCEPLTMSIEPGSAEPFRFVDVALRGELVGDLDGDGLDELLLREDVLASPITWDASGEHGRTVPVSEDLMRFDPLRVDVDGDGAPDLLGAWRLEDLDAEEIDLWVVAPITGGLTGLGAYSAERAWQLRSANERAVPYVDGGRLYLLISDEGVFRRADVGPVR